MRAPADSTAEPARFIRICHELGTSAAAAYTKVKLSAAALLGQRQRSCALTWHKSGSIARLSFLRNLTGVPCFTSEVPSLWEIDDLCNLDHPRSGRYLRHRRGYNGAPLVKHVN
jgi:hypothetical protein